MRSDAARLLRPLERLGLRAWVREDAIVVSGVMPELAAQARRHMAKAMAPGGTRGAPFQLEFGAVADDW